MRLIHLTFIGLCAVLTSSIAMAKDKNPEKQVDPQAMMAIYSKLATPGEPHKQFASLAGSWMTKTKHWMEPDKPPMESLGSCENKMLLGGRFLHQECAGDMMGQPFTGIGVNGYDNHTKKYVSTWMDSMGTGIYYMEGSASADGKTITQKGQYEDPLEGHTKLRGVTRMVDDNTEIFEMYATGKSGKEKKMMEIVYTRKP